MHAKPLDHSDNCLAGAYGADPSMRWRTRATSWTGAPGIVAVGDKLTIGFVGNARPGCTLETLVWS